jgi:uncharacterized protein YndB with AHSA1/START domain
MADVSVIKDLENKHLIIEFIIPASQEEAWKAYSDQAWFKKWWGPEGWETTTKEFDFTPGGKVHYGMKCVDEAQTEWFGQTSWGIMQIEEIATPGSFTYRDYFADEAGNVNSEMPALLVKNEFIAQGDTTKVVSTTYADTTEQLEQLLEMGMVEGFSSQLTKLDALFS